MDQRIRIPGISDFDRETLKAAFSSSDISGTLSFEESSKAGGARFLEPLSATLVVTAMGLTVLAIWICKQRREKTTIEVADRDGLKVTITSSQTSECKTEVLAQLSKLFPDVLKTALS